MERRHQPLEEPKKSPIDVAGVIWGKEQAPYATQAISDSTFRDRATGRAIPREDCVKEAKDWVDFNEK